MSVIVMTSAASGTGRCRVDRLREDRFPAVICRQWRHRPWVGAAAAQTRRTDQQKKDLSKEWK